MRVAIAIVCLIVVVPSAVHSQMAAREPNLTALYAAVGRMHNIDAGLLEAMADVESGGDWLSVSPKGAMGLMQLMPSTAVEFSVPDPFDPVSNLLGAVNFIDYLRARFAGNLNLQGLPDLLAAYNAGPAAVERYGGIPPFEETHNYVRRVIQRYTQARDASRAALPILTRPSFIPKSAPYVLAADRPAISADGDGSVLNQLTEIRRLRRQFIVDIGRAALAENRGPAVSSPR